MNQMFRMQPTGFMNQRQQPNFLNQFGFQQATTQQQPMGQFGAVNPFDPKAMNFGQPTVSDLQWGLNAAPMQQQTPLLANQTQFESPQQGGFGQFMQGGEMLPVLNQENGSFLGGMFDGMSNKDMVGGALGLGTLGLGLWDANSQIKLGKDQLALKRDEFNMVKQQLADRRAAADAVQYAR